MMKGGNRNSVFQIEDKEYCQRRRDATPINATLSKYNKRKLAVANIWYTSRNGKLCILPKDIPKITIKESGIIRVL